jgi:hypothetical protein
LNHQRNKKMIQHIFNESIAVFIFQDLTEENGLNIVKQISTAEMAEKGFTKDEMISDTSDLTSEEFIEKYFPVEQDESTLSTSQFKTLLEFGFEQKQDALYYILPISIPKPLAEAFAEAVMEENHSRFDALRNFWLRLGKCPNPVSRESAYNYLAAHNFQITSQGMLIAYRNVNYHSDNEIPDMVDQVNDLVEKVRKWKKTPRNYFVINDEGELKITRSETEDSIGTLEEVEQDLDKIIMTDARTRTFKIRMGHIVRMDRRKCDATPEKSCSRGLHVGNINFPIHHFGKLSIVVLVDPIDIVSVPEYDENKMRVCRYLPVKFASHDNGNLVMETEESLTDVRESERKLLEDPLVKGFEDFTMEELQTQNIIPKDCKIGLFSPRNLDGVVATELPTVINL